MSENPKQQPDTSVADARGSERAARRAARASEKAARAQARADAARREALEAAVASGLISADSLAAPAPQAPAVGGVGLGTSPHDDAAVDAAAGEGRDEGHEATETPVAAPDEPADGRSGGRFARPGTRRTGPRRSISRTTRLRLLAVLVLLTVVMGALTAWAVDGWRHAVTDRAAERALSATPDEASAAASSIVTDMFTYDWQTIAGKMDAVEPRLTGDAEHEFRTSSRPAVESAAKQQKASVFSTVAASAPIEIIDTDNVRVLVMLNRMVSTNKEQKAQSASSRIEVLMSRVDGDWKLAKLKSI